MAAIVRCNVARARVEALTALRTVVADSLAECFVLHLALRGANKDGRRRTRIISTERKDYPISMRLPEADLAMIDRVANLLGRSRTDFVRDAAVRAAEEVVMDHALLRMSPDGFA